MARGLLSLLEGSESESEEEMSMSGVWDSVMRGNGSSWVLLFGEAPLLWVLWRSRGSRGSVRYSACCLICGCAAILREECGLVGQLRFVRSAKFPQDLMFAS